MGLRLDCACLPPRGVSPDRIRQSRCSPPHRDICHADIVKKVLDIRNYSKPARSYVLRGREVRPHIGGLIMSSMKLVVATACDYAKVQDAAEDMVSDGLKTAAKSLKAYIPEDATNPRETEQFKSAGDAVKLALRAVYASKQRYTGRDRSTPVNTAMLKTLLDMPDAEREKLAKDSPEKKAWTAMLADCRKVWSRIADEAFPKPKTEDAANSGKKAPSADSILANLDAFIAQHGKDSILAKNLADQIRARFA